MTGLNFEEDIVLLKKVSPKKRKKTAIVFTKKRLFFITFLLLFYIFWDFVAKILENKIEKTELFDNLYLEIINLNFINYFAFFFKNELQNFKIIYLLNQIFKFNLFYINYYNYFCIYCNEKLEMLENYSSSIYSKNKIDGKILEIKTGFTIVLGKYKRYYRNKKEEDINLDLYEYKDELYEWDEVFSQKEKERYLPHNFEALLNLYGEEEKKKRNSFEILSEEEESEWEALYGPHGFHDLRFIYKTINRLRREEKDWFTDPYYYYKNLNKLNIDFYIFDQLILRILEIFILKWSFFLINSFFFNEKINEDLNFILPQSAFQIKIDLNTFLSLTKYLSYYRNYMYDKYIYTHDKLFLKFTNCLFYINKVSTILNKIDLKLDFCFVKNLFEKVWFIVNIKKERNDLYFLTFDKSLCRYLYENSFLIHKNLVNKNFLNCIRIIVKDLNWSNFNYYLYEILLEKSGFFEVEEWFYYRYDNIDRYLNYSMDNKILILSILIKNLDNHFIFQLFLNTYIYKFNLITDFYYNQNSFKKILLKVLKFSVAFFISKKLSVELLNKFEEIYFLDEEFWFKWFLKKFRFFTLTNIIRISIEPIDYFCFWIGRKFKSYNLVSSKCDLIFNSKYISHLILSRLLFENSLYKYWKNEDLTIFDLDKYFIINFYKDLILNIIEFSLKLNLLWFFIFEKNIKFKNIYKFSQYYLLRHFVWNDLNKLKF